MEKTVSWSPASSRRPAEPGRRPQKLDDRTRSDRGRLRRHARERGQAVVLLALMVVALMAVMGLSIDLGRGYVDRRALQTGADGAADGAVRMLVSNARGSASYTDSQISTTIGNLLNASTAGDSKVSSWQAWYTDSSGSNLATVGSGSIPSGAAGIKTSPQYQHGTLFVKLVGASTAQEAATGTSVEQAVQSVDTTSGSFGPYAVWQINCVSPPRAIRIGDQVIFRSNGYGSHASCDPNYQVGSNNFKGYFHDPSETTINQGDTFTSKGGNALGQEPLTELQNAYTNHTLLVFPVIDTASGNGANLTMHDNGFVALTMDASWSNPSQDWTGTVQAFIPSGQGYGSCSGSCPPPTSTTPFVVQLIR